MLACDTMQAASFRKSRNARNGPEMCAVDTANKTISPSSLQDCLLGCTTDLTCSGFNNKDSHTCDVYNYNPKIIILNSSCTYYQVASYLLIALSFSCLLVGICCSWPLFLVVLRNKIMVLCHGFDLEAQVLSLFFEGLVLDPDRGLGTQVFVNIRATTEP